MSEKKRPKMIMRWGEDGDDSVYLDFIGDDGRKFGHKLDEPARRGIIAVLKKDSPGAFLFFGELDEESNDE